MKKIPLHHRDGICDIHCGEPFAALVPRIDPRRTLIVTDTVVQQLYAPLFGCLPEVTVGQGEAIKTLETVEILYRAFLDRGVDRSWRVVAVGGGIVCDIAAYAAATWMRGVRCLLVPTTLLAMVDAAIGGKNGVNYHRFKNLVGTIRQPDEVLIDPAFLKTLPRREMLCGLAEMFKHGLIADAGYLQELERTIAAGGALDAHIARSVEIKVSVVAQDETETGLRRILNFGHTVGHALEKLDPTLAHGEAVAVGMTVAADLSQRRGYIAKADADRVRDILSAAGLPVMTAHRAGDIAAMMRADKKKSGDTLAFILLKKLGEAVIVDIPFTELEVTLATVCQHR